MKINIVFSFRGEWGESWNMFAAKLRKGCIRLKDEVDSLV
jgi:hypothetical protein